MLSHFTDAETKDQVMWLPNGTELGLGLGRPGPELPLSHASLWFLHLCRSAHRIEATELVTGHGDDHSDDLPADRGTPEQLQHGHQTAVPLLAALRQDLLHLSGDVLFAQECLESCQQGQAQISVGLGCPLCLRLGPTGMVGPTKTHSLSGMQLAGIFETMERQAFV